MIEKLVRILKTTRLAGLPWEESFDSHSHRIHIDLNLKRRETRVNTSNRSPVTYNSYDNLNSHGNMAD